MGTEPRTQQRPEPFQRVDVHLAEPIPVVVPGVLARRMADRLVIVAPLDQATVNIIFIQDCPAEADVARCILLLLNSLGVISSGFDLNFGVALSHFPFAINSTVLRG